VSIPRRPSLPLIQFSKLSTDEDQRLVFGLASVAVTADGETVTDLQGDQITPDDLQVAFADWLLDPDHHLGDAMHNGKPVSTLIECFVVTPQKLDLLLKALGHTGAPPDFKGVAAWVGYKVHSEDVWKRVKSGELRAFSIEGTGEREEVA
jgi:Putative phage serine protease XkdF